MRALSPRGGGSDSGRTGSGGIERWPVGSCQQLRLCLRLRLRRIEHTGRTLARLWKLGDRRAPRAWYGARRRGA